MNISKLDAAKRQLDTAINLYFKDADPVSIHTLTAAAHQILMDLANIQEIKSFLKQSTLIKKEMQKQYLLMINEAENFFKHAKEDPLSLLSFKPELTETLLLDAVEMYMQLTNEKPEDMSIYRVWFLLNHPTIINEQIRKEFEDRNIHCLQYVKTTNKTTFYKNIKDSLMRF